MSLPEKEQSDFYVLDERDMYRTPFQVHIKAHIDKLKVSLSIIFSAYLAVICILVLYLFSFIDLFYAEVQHRQNFPGKFTP